MIEKSLAKRGFIVVQKDENILIVKIKSAIIELALSDFGDNKEKFYLHQYLESPNGLSYRMQLKIFKKHEHHSIEKYFILQKIEKVKEFIEQNNLSFYEIAYQVGYRSPQHLSSQFREHVGVTMLKYRIDRMKKRKFIDTI